VTAPDIVIEMSAARDIDAVMQVMDTAFDPVFGEAWNRGQCLGMLTLPDVWLLTARADGEDAVAGFALTRRTVDEAELLLIGVRPAARGKGIGRALIERTCREARIRGAVKLMLEVRATNPALDLYRKSGFRQIGRRKDYYRGADGQLNDALTLSRPLAIALP
jgi:ribosomal-protein-alanine N-acetyltransferase